MNKIWSLTLAYCFLTFVTVQAQGEKYTYLTDKKFSAADDLYGYTFVPGIMEVATPGQTSQGEQQEISAGSVKFGITRGNLFVKGKGIDGVHNINQISSTDYGYKLILMNARDPKQQGHLKIIKLKSFVDALVFKASNEANEMIFLLPEISETLNKTEKAYFTDRNEIALEHEEDIWGMEFKPFFKVFMPKRVYQRVQKSDNVSINFIVAETIVEKGKKKNKEVVLSMNDPVKEEEVVAQEKAPEPEPKVEKEIEVVEEEEEEDDLPTYFNIKKKAPKKEVVEVVEEEEPEVLEEEEDLFADTKEVEQVREEQVQEDSKKKKGKEKKVKTKIDYEIVIQDFVFNDDGTHEPIERILSVKDWKLREDSSGSNPYEVYQLEIETNKGPVFVYLSSSRKITKIDCGEVIYLMRGN